MKIMGFSCRFSLKPIHWWMGGWEDAEFFEFFLGKVDIWLFWLGCEAQIGVEFLADFGGKQKFGRVLDWKKDVLERKTWCVHMFLPLNIEIGWNSWLVFQPFLEEFTHQGRWETAEWSVCAGHHRQCVPWQHLMDGMDVIGPQLGYYIQQCLGTNKEPQKTCFYVFPVSVWGMIMGPYLTWYVKIWCTRCSVTLKAQYTHPNISEYYSIKVTGSSTVSHWGQAAHDKPSIFPWWLFQIPRNPKK